MISSVIDSGTLYREHIEIVLDDTEGRAITPWITTDTAERLTHISHRMTLFALMYLGVQISEGTREVGNIGSIGLQEKKGELGRRLLANSWEEVDHVDNSLEGFWHRDN